MNRRDFLKGIGATMLAVIAGKPVYDSLLKQEYCLSVELTGDMSKYLNWESIKQGPRGTLSIVMDIDPAWVQECVSITDQYNRPWEIVGYFEGLCSPEGWAVPLDRLNL